MAKKKRSSRKRSSHRSSSRATTVTHNSSARIVGKWAFIIGVLVALLAGLIPSDGTTLHLWVAWILVVLGLVVGILNISRFEQTAFLVAGLGLLLASTAVSATVPLYSSVISNVLVNVVAFVAPAVLIVSIIAIANLARD